MTVVKEWSAKINKYNLKFEIRFIELLSAEEKQRMLDNDMTIPKSLENGHYCDYVVFEDRPLMGAGYDGIVEYIPIHGGVTYAQPEEGGGFKYGFDCPHLGDEKDQKTRDVDGWLTQQCELLGLFIILAAQLEELFLANKEEALLLLEDGFQKIEDSANTAGRWLLNWGR